MASYRREYPQDRPSSNGRGSSSRRRDAAGRPSSRSSSDSLDAADRPARSRDEQRRTLSTSSSHSDADRREAARRASARRGAQEPQPSRLHARAGDERRSRRSAPRTSATAGHLLESILAADRNRLLVFGIAAMIVVIVVLFVLLVSSLDGCSSSSQVAAESDEADEGTTTATSLVGTVTGATVEERLAACASWATQSALDFLDIADENGVFGFDLSGENETPTLSLGSIMELAEALAPYEEAEVPYGFLIVDLETGLGFACNLDETVYGASSFKAIFCTFIGLTYLDNGPYSLSSMASEIDVDGAEGTSYYTTTTLSELFTNAIVYSGNEAFVGLRNLFSDDDLAAWLEELGVDGDIAYDTSFPHYTVRAAAALWLTVYHYWQTDSDVAAFIQECCYSTETSFLRDALEAAGYDVTVYDKAGWNADGDASDGVDYNAVCDNGIVTYNGRDYLVCVMLGASYSDSTVEHAETLMAAVFALVEDLA